MARYTQIYMPVTHSNGKRLVQITNEDGGFCGWADGGQYMGNHYPSNRMRARNTRTEGRPWHAR
mgnify:CR=1 FL=1